MIKYHYQDKIYKQNHYIVSPETIKYKVVKLLNRYNSVKSLEYYY